MAEGGVVGFALDGRPALKSRGIYFSYSKGNWYPVCMRSKWNGTTASILGRYICEDLGFSDLKTVKMVKVNESCNGFYMTCHPVPTSQDSWPWLVTIYVDGEVRCSAVILDTQWLLCTEDCIKNIE